MSRSSVDDEKYHGEVLMWMSSNISKNFWTIQDECLWMNTNNSYSSFLTPLSRLHEYLVQKNLFKVDIGLSWMNTELMNWLQPIGIYIYPSVLITLLTQETDKNAWFNLNAHPDDATQNKRVEMKEASTNACKSLCIHELIGKILLCSFDKKEVVQVSVTVLHSK